MATKSLKREKSEGWSKCQGQSILQSSDWWDTQSSRKGAPKTPEQIKRKGSFLVRMGSAKGPLMKDGKKTRLKLSLEAWGHFGDKASAVAKGP